MNNMEMQDKIEKVSNIEELKELCYEMLNTINELEDAVYVFKSELGFDD